MTENNIGRIIYVLYFSLIIYLSYLIVNFKIAIIDKIFIFFILTIVGFAIFGLIYTIICNYPKYDIDIVDILVEDFKTIKQQTINIIKFYLNI